MTLETANVTIHKVAGAAGVSISTVSRVVNKQGRVSPKTRQRVESAIRDLGFHPNSRAQALSKKRTDTIGLLVPDFEGQYFSTLMEGAHQEAQSNGIHLMVLKAKGAHSKIETITQMCVAGRTDGLILMLDEIDDVLDAVAHVKSPLVILDKDVQYHRFDNILVDNRTAAYEAARHFIDVHHADNLFFIGGPENNVDTTDRAGGFCDALKQAGLPTEHAACFGEFYSYEQGYRLAQEHIAHTVPSKTFTGIVAANDDIACGAIDALIDSGLNVPGQVGVIGFDDSYIAVRRRLKLSSMRIPMQEIGRQAVKMIINRLDNRELEPAKIILKAKLVARQSCGCK